MATTVAATVDRAAKKARTRRALRDAGRAEGAAHGCGGLSLREVCRRAGVVPGAFYRHFASVDELGLALVDESFEALHRMLLDVRAGGLDPRDLLGRSVEVLVRHVEEHPEHFRFIARERNGGSATLRQAIRSEIRLFTAELATDLARTPGLEAWRSDDLQMLAGLIVQSMVATVEAVLDVPADRPDQLAAIVETVTKQVRLALLGVPHWRPKR